ncbi:DUF58 domain-containing protein [Ruminiclostridium cellulolyticum]|uniref:DUF58 domain-containing protein n=1 Tax=Ruminiclostridium cellulolyticum (strain ATCC 35319 / DSM 5812 / JCM 6584 / H10) TaxID=394503 RepID=B8I2R8_RUMCH|nr:DUF58 domain-containing protein [Ruminiclostridium cellulolyticum]ACL76061.1 protein of unknown function DUF58 [Ruminiclostridium cellulolyticum H10]
MRKNRITFIFLFILSIVFLYNFGGFVSYFFFNTFLALLILSIAYTIFIFVRIKFIQEIDKRVIIKGENVKLVVKISNEDILLYPYVFASFYSSHSALKGENSSQSLSINPKSHKEFIFDMECKFRGEYEVGLREIYIEDFLGLIKLKYKIPEPKKIIVYPKIEHLSNFSILSSGSSDSQSVENGIQDNMNNIKDIREYIDGDSFRKIHWKLTARNDKLMIKNYEGSIDANVNILLDLRKNVYNDEENIIIEDKLIEAVVAVLYFYLSKSIPVNYVYFSEKLEVFKASTMMDFEQIYKTLSCVNFDQQVAMPDILRLHSESCSNSSDMIVFTSILDIDLYNEMYKSQMANHTVTLIYVSPDSFGNVKSSIIEDIMDNLPEIGIKAYSIHPDDDIKILLGGSD